MSYIGKILIGAQLVMSLLFMAFAGAVYSMHLNWKGKYEATNTQLQAAQSSVTTVQGELEQAKRDADTKVAAAKAEADQATALNTTLNNQLVQLRTENNALEQQRDSQTGLADAKANEAVFRQNEANLQRIQNQKLQESLNAKSAEVRSLKDQLATLTESMDDLTERYDTLLKKAAYMERSLAANKLPTDPREIEKLELPAPPVEGVVTEVRKNRANRVEFVEMSIGSDDGLILGHKVDVFRRADARWLGQLRIVSVYPDKAVGEIILPATNGIIQEGDDVTTKL